MGDAGARHAERFRGDMPFWLAICGFVFLVGLCTVTNIDLAVSARFYDTTGTRGWFWKAAFPWRWLYRYGEYPAILMAVGGALVWALSFVRSAWAGHRRRCLILVLAVVLGPGVLVNGLLKPLWGRPRPRQIVQFGGSRAYRPWWQPGGPGAGKSFPSGHAAMGYIVMAAGYGISRRRWRLQVVIGSLGYGTLMGLTRVVQGGHFVSDVVWSGGLMYGVVIGLQAALGRDAGATGPQAHGRTRRRPT